MLVKNISSRLQRLNSKQRKRAYFYEFPFNLNSSDTPDDAQTWESNSSSCPIITENQFQAYSKKFMGH